jgi:tungstate transport system permease protein
LGFLSNSFWNALNLIAGMDREVYFIVWTSLKISASSTFFAAVMGIPLGLLIALNTFKGKSTLLIILNTLMALPTVVVGLFFYAVLSRSGPLGYLGLLFTPAGMMIGLFVLALPTVVNLSISAIQGIDRNLFLTIKTLGAGRFQQSAKILTEARFAVTAALVVAFGRVISEVGIAMMLGGNIKGFTRTMTTAIALETSKGEFELGLALGIILLTVALIVNALLFRLQARAGK